MAAPQDNLMPENDQADKNLEQLGYGTSEASNLGASKRLAKRKKRSGFPGWLRNLILTIFLIGVVVGSFWVAFNLGANMLAPVRRLTGEKKVESTTQPKEKPKALMDRLDKIFNQELEKVKESENGEKNKTAKSEKNETKSQVKIKIEPKIEEPEKIVYSTGNYFVQAGVFSHKSNAMAMVSKLENKGISATYQNYGKYFRVKVGSNTDKNTALKLAQRIRSYGYDAIVVTR